MTIAAVSATNAATSTAATTSASTSAYSSTFSNFSTFLSILTTQLTHQDPTSATDTNQFTQELVQFAQVEQQLNTNSDLGQLINLQKSSNGLTATLNYIGKYVEVPTSSDQLVLQNSSSELGYKLNSAAKSVGINVTDSTGTTVATLSGSGNPGLNYVTWNGLKSDGTKAADGTYNFTLNAINSDGTPQSITDVRTIGIVTGVSSNSDGTYNVSVGNSLAVNSSLVDAVYNAGNLPTVTK